MPGLKQSSPPNGSNLRKPLESQLEGALHRKLLPGYPTAGVDRAYPLGHVPRSIEPRVFPLMNLNGKARGFNVKDPTLKRVATWQYMGMFQNEGLPPSNWGALIKRPSTC